MKIKHMLSLVITGCALSISLVGCAGGDRDNNGKEDNRNRRMDRDETVTPPDQTRTSSTDENVNKDTTGRDPIHPPK